MSTTIRPAGPLDAPSIAALQLRVWWRNYDDIVAPQHRETWDEESRTAHWTQTLADVRQQTFVAELAGAVHGFTTVVSGPDGEPADAGELDALYVDPPAQGAGLGTALLATAEQALRAAGCRTAELSVLEENGLARTFYERHGWVLVPGGAWPHAWGVHVRYRRSL